MKRKGKIQIRKNRKGEPYVVFLASNGKVLAKSESYKKTRSAHTCISSMKKLMANNPEIETPTVKPTRKPKPTSKAASAKIRRHTSSSSAK